MLPRLRSSLAILVLFLGCGGTNAPPALAPILIARAPAYPVPPLAPSASQVAVPAMRLPPNWPYQTPAVVKGSKGIVVTDNAIGSQVGRDMLVAGGNAVDAAVATAFALA